MTEKGTLNSWIMYSLRETLEDQKVRNKILRANVKSDKVVFSKTIYGEEDFDKFDEDIYKLLKGFRKKDTYYLFTLSNPYDPDTNETHFQSFIFINDTINNHVLLYTIEPSGGLYNDYSVIAAKRQFSKLYRGSEAFTEYIGMTNACQRDTSDVFCQSWSLYVQLQAILVLLTGKTENIDIKIPKNENKKYELLLNFYKDNMKSICKELKENFNNLLTGNDLKNILEKKQVAPTKIILRKYEDKICDIIKHEWNYNIFSEI